MSTTHDLSSPRTRRARHQPLRAEQVAPGMYEVQRLTADDESHVYTVDVREGACECEDYTYRMGPAGGACKHLRFVRLVEDGVLCPGCGYEICRPSCPERPTTEEDSDR